jgi:hypothetical protein
MAERSTKPSRSRATPATRSGSRGCATCAATCCSRSGASSNAALSRARSRTRARPDRSKRRRRRSAASAMAATQKAIMGRTLVHWIDAAIRNRLEDVERDSPIALALVESVGARRFEAQLHALLALVALRRGERGLARTRARALPAARHGAHRPVAARRVRAHRDRAGGAPPLAPGRRAAARGRLPQPQPGAACRAGEPRAARDQLRAHLQLHHGRAARALRLRHAPVRRSPTSAAAIASTHSGRDSPACARAELDGFVPALGDALERF